MKTPYKVHAEILFYINKVIGFLIVKSLSEAFLLVFRDHVICDMILFSSILYIS